jgi:hypothetical protein
MDIINNRGGDIQVRHADGIHVIRPGMNVGAGALPDELVDHPYVQGLFRDGDLVEIKKNEDQDLRASAAGAPPRFAAHEVDHTKEPATETSLGARPPEDGERPFGSVMSDEERANLAREQDPSRRQAAIDQGANPTRASGQNQDQANQRDARNAAGPAEGALGRQQAADGKTGSERSGAAEKGTADSNKTGAQHGGTGQQHGHHATAAHKKDEDKKK